MKRNHLLLLLMAGFGLVAIEACSKNDKTGSSITNLRVNLTDAPLDELDSIFIDIREVRVKMGNDTTNVDDNGWVNLVTTAGVYDLLSYQNGIDTLIGSGNVPTGYVKEIRLILGENNRVVDSFGTVYPLTIPSGSESGLKIKINKNLRPNLDSLLIDFDAALSIRKEASGYKLRPVIKLK